LTETKNLFENEQAVYDYFKKNDPMGYRVLGKMNDIWRDRLVGYMTGKKTLPFTYDPFFKMVFDPELHPERISSFISAIVGEDLQVEEVLPTEQQSA